MIASDIAPAGSMAEAAAVPDHLASVTGDDAYLRADMTVAEACRLIWREQLQHIAASEAGVRADRDAEYVHNMRIAVRRARVAARLFGRYFRSKSTRRYVEWLRTTGRLLGAVRDLDVALARAKRAAKRMSVCPSEGLTAEWQRRRDDAHKDLIKWLDSGEYKSCYKDYVVFASTPGRDARKPEYEIGVSPTPYHVCDVLPAMIVSQFVTIRSYEYLFDPAYPAAGPDYATLHALRIDCKYLRYTLEFMHPLIGASGDALIMRLKQLQSDLGDLNDAVVSRRFVDQAHSNKPHDQQYAQAQDTEIQQLSLAVPKLLAEFTGLDARRQLGEVVASL